MKNNLRKYSGSNNRLYHFYLKLGNPSNENINYPKSNNNDNNDITQVKELNDNYKNNIRFLNNNQQEQQKSQENHIYINNNNKVNK